MNEQLINLIRNSKELFWRYGIKSVTMDDIAREFGMSKKTLYQLVSDKTELVSKVVEMELESITHKMECSCQMDCTAITSLFNLYTCMKNLVRNNAPNLNYDLKKYYPDLYKRLWELKKKIIQETFIANIRQGKAQGLYRMQADEQVIAHLHLLLINGIINADECDLPEVYSSHFHLQTIEYHVRGIATLSGIEEMERNLKQLNEQNS